jgi:hypothetical protein
LAAYVNVLGGTSANGGSQGSWRLDYWPRIYVPNPEDEIVAEGVISFAFFLNLPSGGAWSTFTTANCFLSFFAFVDTTGKPILFIGLKAGGDIQVRRWNNSPSNFYWNTNPYFDNSGYEGALVGVVQYVTQSNSLNSQNYTLDHNKFTLIGESSTGQVVDDEWNYIEMKYKLATDATGYVQVKVNREQSDNTYDINASSIQTR